MTYNRVYRVTLDIATAPEDDRPDSWDWPTLLDMFPDTVTVRECHVMGAVQVDEDE